MKAILKFNLPEEYNELYNAANASNVLVAIRKYSNKLRSMYKYEEIETIDTEEARQMLFDVFIEDGLDTDYL